MDIAASEGRCAILIDVHALRFTPEDSSSDVPRGVLLRVRDVCSMAVRVLGSLARQHSTVLWSWTLLNSSVHARSTQKVAWKEYTEEAVKAFCQALEDHVLVRSRATARGKRRRIDSSMATQTPSDHVFEDQSTKARVSSASAVKEAVISALDPQLWSECNCKHVLCFAAPDGSKAWLKNALPSMIADECRRLELNVTMCDVPADQPEADDVRCGRSSQNC